MTTRIAEGAYKNRDLIAERRADYELIMTTRHVFISATIFLHDTVFVFYSATNCLRCQRRKIAMWQCQFDIELCSLFCALFCHVRAQDDLVSARERWQRERDVAYRTLTDTHIIEVKARLAMLAAEESYVSVDLTCNHVFVLVRNKNIDTVFSQRVKYTTYQIYWGVAVPISD